MTRESDGKVVELSEVMLRELEALTGDRDGKLLVYLQRRRGLWVVRLVVPFMTEVEHSAEDIGVAIEHALVEFMARRLAERGGAS